MSSEVIIKAEGVSKKFSLSLKNSIKWGLVDIARDFIGTPSKSEELRLDEFWALQDVNFEVRRGECLGLIGPNGAGKSTLLKMLNGIIRPDKGAIEIHGRVGALIEVGAGFHPLLTGRENIYINGAIMGLSRAEINDSFDAIVDFADLGKFLDMPVSYYSSGMYVRLGFAVAAHLKPDILLIDEVLAVGDAGFRAKCYERIYSILREAAVIFVSHSMVHVNRMCNSVLLLGKETNLFSSPAHAIKRYHELVKSAGGSQESLYSNGETAIKNLSVKGVTSSEDIFTGGVFQIAFVASLPLRLKCISLGLSILSQEKIAVAYSRRRFSCTDSEGKIHISFITQCIPLAPGDYSLAITMFDDDVLEQMLWYFDVSPFTVKGDEGFMDVPVVLQGIWHGNAVA